MVIEQRIEELRAELSACRSRRERVRIAAELAQARERLEVLQAIA